ncbi:hypothetical protein JCM8547_001280 [Rhodosporidiobolus lusitaniae]
MNISDNASPYPPRAVPLRQQSPPTSPLLDGRRGSGSSTGSGGCGSSTTSRDEDGLTPLDRTLEMIGFGRYQATLLVLCGMGWLADNMWLQCIAVILPRVQESFEIEDRWIGLLSTSIFAGMMVGAWGWGSYSDAHGRLPAFNLTLFLTAIFGLASAFAPSFGWLCFALFLLGTGVGGSMPTDGTLFLENIPQTHHYLLTGLSVFFSIGAVFTSLLGLAILPRYSCSRGDASCDVETHNVGWRYMLGALGIISIAMFLARILLIRLQESAKFLVASNRPSAAVIALRRISKINGQDHRWVLSDVVDEPAPSPAGSAKERRTSNGGDYESTGETRSPSRGPSPFPPLDTATAGEGNRSPPPPPASDTSDLDVESDLDALSYGSGTPTPSRPFHLKSRPAWISHFPSSWHSAVEDYAARMEELLEPEWKRTTLLVWMVWTLASAGYTIFNVFLPRFLEAKLAANPSGSSPEQTLRDYVLYTVSGLPGSILGAYLVETSWGRAKTLALSTLATSAGTFVFAFVSSTTGVVLSSMAVSLAATLMYAVIYSLTPAVFPTTTRGTACGIASALSRLAGIIAPLFTGVLLSINISLPLFVSGACFFATAACAWALRGMDEKAGGEGGRRGGGGVAVH